MTLDNKQFDMVSDCDFRMAISFRNRKDGTIANHTHLENLIDVQTIFGGVFKNFETDTR